MARYIDADKLNEILVSGFIDENDALVESPEECNSMLVWAIQEAKGMPTADVVERKVGKWLVIEDELWEGGGRYECSVCGCGFAFGAFHEMDEQHYCPNCGAQMDERREDEN